MSIELYDPDDLINRDKPKLTKMTVEYAQELVNNHNRMFRNYQIYKIKRVGAIGITSITIGLGLVALLYHVLDK
tara:strand:+ start:1213 stop:1434 length:222 start_codon:yes stop_codon:yes gene_type:complete